MKQPARPPPRGTPTGGATKRPVMDLCPVKPTSLRCEDNLSGDELAHKRDKPGRRPEGDDDMNEAASSQRPVDHPAVAAGRIGVLLVNLGTPDATDYWSMRRYLKQFLSDRRVIETPRAIWWPLLNLVILSTRPSRKGRDYDTIWNRERNEGPLKTITRGQAEKLAATLEERSASHRRLGHALRQSQHRRARSRRCKRRGPIASSSCRSIRNMPPPPRPPFATTPSAH